MWSNSIKIEYLRIIIHAMVGIFLILRILDEYLFMITRDEHDDH